MPKLPRPKERHYKLAEFLQMGLTPAKAAIRAGFKPSTANKQAKRICSHPAVRAAILEIQTRQPAATTLLPTRYGLRRPNCGREHRAASG